MKKNYFLLLFIGIVQLFNAQCIVAPNISYSGVSASYPAGTAITPLIITNTGDPVVTVSNQMTTLVSNVTSPQGVAVDAAGNLYYLDYFKNGKWINSGVSDFDAFYSKPADGCAVSIELIQ